MGKFEVEIDGKRIKHEGTPEEFYRLLELMGVVKLEVPENGNR